MPVLHRSARRRLRPRPLLPLRFALALAAATASCSSGNPAPAGSAPQPQPRVLAVDAQGIISDQPGTVITSMAEARRVVAIAAPPEDVFAALTRAYPRVGIEVTLVDPDGFRVGNPRFLRRRTLGKELLSHYLRCGESLTGPRADTDRITLSVVSEVRAAGTDTSYVETVVGGDAQDVQSGTGGAAGRCTSTGVLEMRLHAETRLALVK